MDHPAKPSGNALRPILRPDPTTTSSGCAWICALVDAETPRPPARIGLLLRSLEEMEKATSGVPEVFTPNEHQMRPLSRVDA